MFSYTVYNNILQWQQKSQIFYEKVVLKIILVQLNQHLYRDPQMNHIF
jgi:hypothetical protein